MKIIEGHFPWKLLYVPLASVAAGTAGYLTITDGWDQSVDPGLWLFGAMLNSWWSFLLICSGVVPSGGLGPAIYRGTNPCLFWMIVAFYIALALLFISMAVAM